MLSEQKKESHDIGAHFVYQLVERHVSGSPRRHLDLRASPSQGHELVNYRPDRPGIVAERPQRSDHPFMFGDMVGTEYIDDFVKAAPQLIDMIRDVRRPISRLSGRADQNLILFVDQI